MNFPPTPSGNPVPGQGPISLADLVPDGGALSRLDSAQARRLKVLPIGWGHSGAIVIAVAAEQVGDLTLRDDLTRLTRNRVEFVVADPAEIVNKIEQVYRVDAELSELADEVSEDLAGASVGGDIGDVATDDAPIIRFVNLLINQAIQDRASDIHVQPGENELWVRYRIDGVLVPAHTVPKKMASGVITRLKLIANIDIAERRKPQDGRITFTHRNRDVDLRVNTMPTVWGEKIVMRILDMGQTHLALTDLGFSKRNLAMYERSYRKAHGMVLVTGPTGSGKSTTLYATLNVVAKPSVNVLTVEDPVEYRLPHISQVQVNEKAGLTFAEALKGFLRQDPDIILVGEIRDEETAEIAVKAAQTGHLVFSTMHTNDAPSAIVRLVEMGIPPYLIGSALDSVLAQRLCRRLCDRCKEPYQPTVAELAERGFKWPAEKALPTLYRPVGCGHCAKTGYTGRIAVHEIMPMTETIARLTAARASTEEIRKAAIEAGMTVLRQDGWAKVVMGYTDLDEMLRVVV